MRGHIVKRGKNSYTVVLNMGKDPSTGKWNQQWVSVKGTKKDAEKRLSDMLHQIDTGSFMRPGKTTVADFLERWLNDYAKPNLSPRSYERYESIVRVHLLPRLGSIPLVQLKSAHIQDLYAAGLQKGLSARGVRYHHVVLHKALQTALKWGLVNRNAADGVDVPKARRPEMQTWDENDIMRFLEAAKSTPYHALFHLALFTGMRRGEILALKWSDVDLLGSQICVNRSVQHLRDGSYVYTEPKTAKSRRPIALTPSTAQLLKEYHDRQKWNRIILDKPLTNDNLVFSTLEGKPLRPNTVSRAWQILAARAGVKVIRFHDARHSHASIFLKLGVHPKIVQERLGHSTIAITLDMYSHVAPGLQETAARRFDEAFDVRYNGMAKESISNPLAKRDYVNRARDPNPANLSSK
jgi:integrase